MVNLLTYLQLLENFVRPTRPVGLVLTKLMLDYWLLVLIGGGEDHLRPVCIQV